MHPQSACSAQLHKRPPALACLDLQITCKLPAIREEDQHLTSRMNRFCSGLSNPSVVSDAVVIPVRTGSAARPCAAEATVLAAWLLDRAADWPLVLAAPGLLICLDALRGLLRAP